jgi:hypothetical protein
MPVRIPWSDREMDILRAGVAAKLSASECMKKLPGRSYGAITKKASVMGIQFRRVGGKEHWSPTLKDQLRTLWNDSKLSAGKIAARLGLSRCAVIGKSRRMNLDRRPSPIKRRLAPVQHARQCEWLGASRKFNEPCTAAAAPGKPYCAKHAARCHRSGQPSKPNTMDTFTTKNPLSRIFG